MRSIEDITKDLAGYSTVPQLSLAGLSVPTTGGNQTPVPYTPYPSTGGNQLPVPTYPTTGGNQQTLPYTTPVPPMLATSAPPTGGNQLPVATTPVTAPPIAGPQPSVPVQQPNGNTGIVPPNLGPAQTVNDMVNSFLDGQYAQNARQRGLETAAARGLMNSSIAAGASNRAALEAVQPFVNEGMSLLNNRENRAWQSGEAGLDRQFKSILQRDQAAQQDWLNSNQYNREFNGNLSLIPIANSTQFMQYIAQLGAENPEVYTPNVMSGMQNFFTQSMLAMLQQFLPGGN